MMKVFEIIFILLLMLPVALLMRWFISKLSVQTPKQRKVSAAAEERPSVIAWIKRKDQELDEDYIPEEELEEEPEPAPSYYQPRPFPQMKRSERVSFTEVYGESWQEELEEALETEDHVATASAERKKRKRRSEKRPSKRQKRKNRERARKRELNRREKEQS